jgi:hypothetical protein
MTEFGISVPKTTQWSPKAAAALIRSILQDKRTESKAIRFEIHADQKQIGFHVVVSGDDIDAPYMQALVRAFYPEAEVYTPTQFVLPYPLYRQSILFERNQELFYQRGITVDQIKSPDPLSLLTQTANTLLPGERMEYHMMKYSKRTYTEKDIKQLLSQSWIEAGLQTNVRYDRNSLSDAFAAGITGSILDSIKRTNRFTLRDEEWYRAKLSQPVYIIFVTLSFTTPDPTRLQLFTAARSIIRTFLPTFDINGDRATIRNDNDFDASLPHRNFLNLVEDHRQEKNKKKKEQKLDRLEATFFYWTPEEIATAWHLPHQDFVGQNIHWLKGGQVRIPSQLQNRQGGVLVGSNSYGGNISPVRLSDNERLTHIHVLGKTGTGKSTLLHHMIHQDILSGKGVAVIDPQGKLVENLLRTSIPKGREQEVVVIDLANDEYPPPLNLLALPPGTNHNNASGRIMAMLGKHGSFADTVTVAPTLRAALVTLWQEPTPTVRDVVRVFTNEAYRNQLLAKVDHPVVEDFWEMFEAKNQGQREQLIAPIVTRMTDLYGNPYLYPSICHPDTLDFASLIAQRKIILISLGVDIGKIPDIDRYLLGSMLLFQIQIAVMNGAAKTNPFYLYVDEVHQFITSPLSRMLSEVRQHNLSITLAHQYLDQLEGETLEAVMGTVGTMLVFQCGINDARALAPYLKPNFATDHLLSLDLYHAVISMRLGTQTLPAFNLITSEPIASKKPSQIDLVREQRIRKLSHQLYTPKTREDILAWLKKRYPKPRKPPSDSEELYDRQG